VVGRAPALPATHERAAPTLPDVHWFFTGLLIAASGGTAAYTLWFLRRLFTTAPVGPPPTDDPAGADVAAPDPAGAAR
jgi:hypothetical protein